MATHHEILRDAHYRHLNEWQESDGYKAAKTYEQLEAFFSTLVGKKWEIDERIFDEFLSMLPPINFTGDAFMMCEFVFGDITTKFSREGDRYFCEYARFPLKRSPRLLPGSEPKP